MVDGKRHQVQYDQNIAGFFHDFNIHTGRPELFAGYITGHCLKDKEVSSGETYGIAADFGCGTGWLSTRLAFDGFEKVYGIDTSPSMINQAMDKTPSYLLKTGRVCYHVEIPLDILGRCDLATAVHLHYHFNTKEKLRDDFFGVLASLISKNGEVIMIGCPSKNIRNTPDHFYSCIHMDDIPEKIACQTLSINDYADQQGYVPISCLPDFRVEDGTQLKVVFSIQDLSGNVRKAYLTDTHWNDDMLESVAREAGLSLIRRQELSWRNHPGSYMAMHFRKL